MTLDYRKFKKINLKVDSFFLPFCLQAEARVLMQWYVNCYLFKCKPYHCLLSECIAQYYNRISVGAIEANLQYIIKVYFFMMHIFKIQKRLIRIQE